MITTFYPPYHVGGDALHVQRLASELAQRGHHVDVIHCADAHRGHTRAAPAPVPDVPGVVVHRLESALGPLALLAMQQTGFPVVHAARIRRVLQRGFDVIHYHNVSLIGGPGVLRYGRGVKLYTLHEYWLVCPTHVLFRFNRAACTRPHCLLCCLTYRRPPQWWRHLGLLRAAVRHVDAFLAPSRFVADTHRRMGLNLPIVPLPLFANAVTPTAAVPAPPYFLFVGRLEKLKGVHTLLPLFQRYRKARLLICGVGSYEPELRRLAAPAGNIEFLGHQTEAQLAALYRGAVALLVPSLCYEVFPQVIVEALSHRTPVVVRNLGSLREMVAESGGGTCYDTEDELLAALERLLAQPAYGRALGQRGYEVYRQKWTAEAHIRRYLEVVRQTAAARGAPIG